MAKLKKTEIVKDSVLGKINEAKKSEEIAKLLEQRANLGRNRALNDKQRANEMYLNAVRAYAAAGDPFIAVATAQMRMQSEYVMGDPEIQRGYVHEVISIFKSEGLYDAAANFLARVSKECQKKIKKECEEHSRYIADCKKTLGKEARAYATLAKNIKKEAEARKKEAREQEIETARQNGDLEMLAELVDN